VLSSVGSVQTMVANIRLD